MEDIIEFFATVILELISGGKYKYASTRTWAITIFWLILGGIPLGFAAWALWTQPEDWVVICRCIAALLAAGFLVYVIRGHRRNWHRTWL